MASRRVARWFPAVGLVVFTAAAVSWTGHAQQSTPPYLDLTLTPDVRAADLVSRMTVDEKITQMMNGARGIPRLGVPAYDWWNECLHGVARAGAATSFPQAIGMAASFDTALMREVATVISDEARAKHHEALRNDERGRYQGLTFWSPNINIFRDPRWGRGQETYGEDPYLTARMGIEFVRGLQGDDPNYLKVVATAKHFAVHSGPEADRHHFDVSPTERDLWETYLPAFKALVQEAGVESIMGAYNRVYGESASASAFLLQEVLREQWGFDGYVVSDCGAIDDIFLRHKIVPTAEEASALGVTRGCDLECGRSYRSLTRALEQGLLREENIDVALTRLMRARIRLGMFDPPERVPYAAIPFSVNEAPAHDALARRMAQASMVLLKNDGLLPLSRDLESVAVIGPNADALISLLGNYYGTPSNPVTALAGIRAAVGPDTTVRYARGSNLIEGRDDPMPEGQEDTRDADALLAEAVAAARESDVAIVVGGLNGEVEGEEMRVEYPGFARGDRTSIALPVPQQRLLEAVHATGTPVVFVLMTGSAVSVEWANANVPAILAAWYPGQRGGTAIADVLFGDANPAGRLPVTFYRSVDQLPPFDDYDMQGRTYRYFDGDPLYPFGYGLSYTRFEYSDLTVDRQGIGANDQVTVTVTVHNTGDVVGDEVVQLYTRAVGADIPMPLLSLRGFERVSLAPGEARQVRFTIAPSTDLAFYDTTRQVTMALAGTHEVLIGSSSADIRARTSLQVVIPPR